jgi:hypothetical protein
VSRRARRRLSAVVLNSLNNREIACPQPNRHHEILRHCSQGECSEGASIRKRHTSASKNQESLSSMISYSTTQWQALESVTWTFHVAVEHLEAEGGTTAERLSFCTRQLTMLQPKLLRLPGSLTRDLIQLIGDLRSGHYESDPSRGHSAIRNYYSCLNSALQDSLRIE